MKQMQHERSRQTYPLPQATSDERGSAGYSPSAAAFAPPFPAGSPTYLQRDEFTASPLLARWYRWFTPAPPMGRLATLKERENIRRSRLASVILAVQLFCIELPVVPVVAHAPNHAIVLPWLCGCIIALLCAFFCNKKGKLTLAGLLMVASIEVTVIIKILTVPGGISVFALPQFDILIQPILIAVALLAPWSAFAVAGFNVCFVLFALTAGPHAPDLVMSLHDPTRVGDLFSVPIMGQVLTAVFAFLIVRDLLGALKRADRAEQVAALEHLLAESRRQVETRNQELEQGADAIIQTIRQITSNQPEVQRARVHLSQQNVLWPLAMQLNLFLDRYQRAREADALLERTTAAINELTEAVYISTQWHQPLRVPPLRKTPLDAFLIAIRGEKSNGGGTAERTP